MVVKSLADQVLLEGFASRVKEKRELAQSLVELTQLGLFVEGSPGALNAAMKQLERLKSLETIITGMISSSQ